MMLPSKQFNSDPKLTICIPAYKAEDFIDRTLYLATGQSLQSIRILISIDGNLDKTEDIAKQFSQQDNRIEIIHHTERRGWGENVNELLSRVDTEFFFFYFHDDLLMPQYSETLIRALEANPSAASANCSVQMISNTPSTINSVSYGTQPLDRFCRMWTRGLRGHPLRSMLRTNLFDKSFRFPAIAPDMIQRSEPLLTSMIAGGPSIAVPQRLYYRLIRDDGLVAEWNRKDFNLNLIGWRNSLKHSLDIIKRHIHSEVEFNLVRFVALNHAQISLLLLAKKHGVTSLSKDSIHKDLDALEIPDQLDLLSEEVRKQTMHDFKFSSNVWKTMEIS